MIKYVFMDLDDTLLDFRSAERFAIRKSLCIMLGQEPPVNMLRRYSAINRSLWEQLEAGKITRSQLLLRRFALLYEEFGLSLSPQQTQTHYAHFLTRGYALLPGAVTLLQTLSPRYALYAVSNGHAVTQAQRLKGAGIDGYFEKIFISETMGVNKPDPLFFSRCFAEIPDFKREYGLILGDSLTSDMQGGINAGIKTCWYNPQRLPSPLNIVIDHQIHDLMELPALLERL